MADMQQTGIVPIDESNPPSPVSPLERVIYSSEKAQQPAPVAVPVYHSNASTTSSLSSPSYFEKPDQELDANGFTAGELREHQRSIQHMRALRLVYYSRWLIRVLSVFVSLISFILIIITVLLFLHSGHSRSPQKVTGAYGQVDNLDIQPSVAFGSIGGIFTILSLTVNVLCCVSKRVRRITPISNLIFACVSIAGISAWLSGCFYLHRNSAGKNLWYYVCSAAQAYESADHKTGFSRMLLARDTDDGTDSQGLNFLKMCSYTHNSWNLGILQACFEILTLLNVIIAVVVVKWSWIRIMKKKGVSFV